MPIWPSNQWTDEILHTSADIVAQQTVEEAKGQATLTFDEVRQRVLLEILAASLPAGTA